MQIKQTIGSVKKKISSARVRTLRQPIPSVRENCLLLCRRIW
jgi:hypothetical protein